MDRRSRHDWLDIAKGIGIVLVTLGHAMGGLIDVAGSPPVRPMQLLFFAIYTFHMPMFFFLSAVLVPARIERSAGGFARAIATRVVYPYLLWSIIQYTLIFAAGSLVNSPVDSYWPTILALPWHPVSQFWFLYALAIMQLVTLAVLVVAPVRGGWFLLAAAVGLRLLVPIAPGPGPIGQVMVFFVFYAAGAAIGVDRTARLVQASPRVMGAVAIAAIGAIAVSALLSLLPLLASKADPLSPELAGSAWVLAALPAALLGATACMMLAARLPSAAARFLAELGRASMAIYLVHVIVIAGSRIALLHLAIPFSPGVLVPLLTTLGIAGGLVARYLANRLGIAGWTALR